MKLNYKGATINFNLYGKGQAIVMLHGFLENSNMWESLASTFSKSYQVICPDLLGHGKSDCLGYIHTMEDMADSVYAILEHLKITKAIIIGHSMGGYVALALAEKSPNLIAGLCLLNSTADSDSRERKINRDRAIEQVKMNAPRFIKISIKNLFRPKNRTVYKNEIKLIQEEACQMKVQGIIAALEGMKRRPNRESVLRKYSSKALIIASKKDPVLNFGDLKLLTLRNHILFSELPDGHMSHIENKYDLSYIIKHYIENLIF